MIAVVAPSAGDLLAPLLAARAPVELWTPTAAPAWLGHAPGALGAFARRRPADRKSVV